MHRWSMQARVSLNKNEFLIVVGYVESPDGVVVWGSTDARVYYCDDRFGRMQGSLVDT